MDTAIENKESNLWGGGVSPFKIAYGKLMMWYFLLSDAFTFAGFLITYGAIRFSHDTWPTANKVFNAFPGFGHADLPLMFVSLMTFILIMSSVTMVRAVQEGHMMNRKGVLFWLGLTIVGGLIFLGCQAWEWTHMIQGGMTMTSPITYAMSGHGTEMYIGPVAFGQLFFTITGFHGFHVTTGVIINVIVFTHVLKGTFEKRGTYQMVEKVGLYWHFVDLVWVFVFLGFYLL